MNEALGITVEIVEMLGKLSEERQKEAMLVFRGVITGLLMAA